MEGRQCSIQYSDCLYIYKYIDLDIYNEHLTHETIKQSHPVVHHTQHNWVNIETGIDIDISDTDRSNTVCIGGN